MIQALSIVCGLKEPNTPKTLTEIEPFLNPNYALDGWII